MALYVFVGLLFSVLIFRPFRWDCDYFNIHHTPADTFEKVDKEFLRMNTALLATIAFILVRLTFSLKSQIMLKDRFTIGWLFGSKELHSALSDSTVAGCGFTFFIYSHIDRQTHPSGCSPTSSTVGRRQSTSGCARRWRRPCERCHPHRSHP